LRKIGKPEDVARCALFLVSPDSRFITGADIVVDGGVMAMVAEPLRFNLEELLPVVEEGKKAAQWLASTKG
jgi:hypothetical protein